MTEVKIEVEEAKPDKGGLSALICDDIIGEGNASSALRGKREFTASIYCTDIETHGSHT